ncbi:DUF2059 domain-containing protein [Bacillus sp. HMF5848]|uniref:DUF2059 domain-containing protein n=1 Tax=Bacillus sp. HMF5848 TaxID=2495421 RepID=UPI000F776F3B|nr:DUF2059 domain-containing protein [Bacillus sp. HMF5848]RSK27473.1 DUF2059 domain-containing protein [Bacillus sp. HMF5848]
MNNIEYDNNGRAKYHPDLHPNHGKHYTLSELEYICKFYESDGRKSVAATVGRTESTIAALVHTLRKNKKYDYYKNLNKFW